MVFDHVLMVVDHVLMVVDHVLMVVDHVKELPARKVRYNNRFQGES